MISRLLFVFAVLLVICMSVFSNALATDFYVRPDGNNANDGMSWESPKLTIQTAINAANYGDVIYVGPGTYREKLKFKNGVFIIGDGSETTQIEYSGDDPVVEASGCQSGKLSGFTIVSTGVERPVILLKDSSIIISRNVIKGSGVAGVEAVGSKSAPQIMDNEIRENTWGIILNEGSSGVIAGNVVTGNLYHGIAIVASAPLVTNNVVWGNSNGIFVVDGADPQVSNNTIVSNREAGIWVFLDASPSIFHNIIVSNGMGGIDALGYQYGINGQPIVLFNDVWRNSGANYVGIGTPELDISADPLFIDFDNHDYGLQEGSPCRGAADDGGDLGAYSPLETTVELIPVNVWSELHSRLTSGLVTLKAAVGNSDIQDVTFQYSLDGETWHDIGSDSQAPYSVNWDTRGVPKNISKVWAKAVVTDADGFTARNFTELLLRMKNLQDDQLISLNDFEGHVLLINFWDTWCGPCISEMPDLVKLQNKYNSQKFSVIGMAFGRYGEAKVKETMRGLKVNYPVIMAAGKIERDFEQAWGEAIEAIPTTYVVNRNGEIVSAMRGSRTMNVFENAILPLLAESYEPLELKITSTPVITGTTGADYTYRIITTGGDGGALIYDLTIGPDGMDVDPETGIISWTPAATQAGSHDVTIQVTDASGNSDTQTFTITVAEEANAAPEITSTPVTTSTEGERYTYQVEAEDANNDTLTYSLTVGPGGMTMDEATGVVHWTPSGTQAGSHDIVITVSDGRDGSDTQSFTIDVEESINNTPVIISSPVTSGIKGEPYEYDVEATDADNDTLTYSLTAYPEGMVVDSSTGVISWTPSATQVGSHDVTVEVDDGRFGIDVQSFTIEVAEAANNAPVITSTPVTDGRLNEAYEYRVEATDEDDDALTFSLVTFPEGMAIDANTGVMSWEPVLAQLGDNEVVVQVADGRDETGTQSFTINVTGIKGDVNGDGNVRANDAILSLRIASGMMNPSDYEKWAADMNEDGKVRANDSILILRKASGLAAPGGETRRRGDAETRGVTLSLNETRGMAGGKVSVPLKIDGASGLAGGDIVMAYDPGVIRAVGVSSDEHIMLSGNMAEAGKIQIAFASVDGLNNEELAEIQFQVLENEISPLKFREVELYGPDALPLSFRFIDAEFRAHPEHTMLLQNFPNPFNPETWIPYELTEAADVTVRIYDVRGQIVRTLRLGHRSAGFYLSKDKAAYWDGRNDAGEAVASGVYFYNIQAGEFAATRKMTIAK